MAVSAAHLTRTLNEKPSIFEVIAQESLQATLQPALKKLTQFICFCDPNKYGWALRWFDEIYLLFNTVLQRNYLRYTSASFSENFYGLRRISLEKHAFNDGIHLSFWEEKMSLFFVAIFPYLRTKMNQYCQIYLYQQYEETKSQDWKMKMRYFLSKFYSVFHFFYEFLCLIQFLLYISGKSHSHSPLLKILSLSLVYSSNVTSDNEATWSNFWNAVSKGQPGSAKITFEMIGTALLRSLEIGAFFVQFLKWWDDKGPHMNGNEMPVPHFPTPDVRASDYMNKCPICLQSWKIPTILPVSGYIFCYKCITRHLKDDQKCPVTKYHVDKDDLIRVYL